MLYTLCSIICIVHHTCHITATSLLSSAAVVVLYLIIIVVISVVTIALYTLC